MGGATTSTGAHWAGNKWVGRRMSRLEDAPLLTGRGRYTGDIAVPGTLEAVFVRSTAAHGAIRGIDTADALRLDGVHAVITARDLTESPGLTARLEREGFATTTMPLLATDRVRYAGEPVAVVLAADRARAEDGAEAVVVDIAEAPAVTSIDQVRAGGAAVVHDEAPDNILLDSTLFSDDLEAVLESSHLVVTKRVDTGRVVALPMEARSSHAHWDGSRLTLHTSTQVPHMVRSAVAEQMGLMENQVRVVAPDVGGGFGQKCVVAREEVTVAVLARLLDRPVRWVEDRGENIVASFAGHEQVHEMTAGFTTEGMFSALSTVVWCDVGAYSAYPFTCAVEPLMAAGELPGPYRVPRYAARGVAVATNKSPTAPYRGVSRPQITLAVERLLDEAARRLGIDRAEIRRRNLIRPGDFPYTGANLVTYDAGTYGESLEDCLAELGYEDWPQRQARARAEGRLLGLGFVCFSERTGYGTPVFAGRGMAVTPGFDTAVVTMDPTGGVTVTTGVSAHGQGHATTFAQIVADQLGIEPSRVRVIEGDTDAVPFGWGTFGSRSIVIGGSAAHRAAGRLADKLARLAAHRLEAAVGDIVLEGGAAHVRGTPSRSVPLATLAHDAHIAVQHLPEGEEPGLEAHDTYDPPGTFSNATHGAIVEIDPGTGGVRIDRYVVVEDCGVIINPLIVDGQVHGGVTQGIACALYEGLDYDDEGQCRTATLMDYLAPTAMEIPDFELHHLETPSEHSATGAKGMGEGGTIGAPACVVSAVADAVAHLGIDLDHIPISPEYLAMAIESAQGTPGPGEGT